MANINNNFKKDIKVEYIKMQRKRTMFLKIILACALHCHCLAGATGEGLRRETDM
jgi:hypothetical protein